MSYSTVSCSCAGEIPCVSSTVCAALVRRIEKKGSDEKMPALLRKEKGLLQKYKNEKVSYFLAYESWLGFYWGRLLLSVVYHRVTCPTGRASKLAGGSEEGERGEETSPSTAEGDWEVAPLNAGLFEQGKEAGGRR